MQDDAFIFQRYSSESEALVLKLRFCASEYPASYLSQVCFDPGRGRSY
jgi:hypothetical protein